VDDVVQALAAVVTGAGLAAGVVVLLATAKGLFALRVGVEFWTAAGMLRLVGDPGWHALVTAAVVLALRQLLAYAQRHPAIGTHATGSPPHRH